MAGFALLRVAPLLSATSYITFTFCEDTFIRPLLHTAPSSASTELRQHANRIQPAFINSFTPRGLPFIFLTYPLSIATAAANLKQHDSPGVSFAGDAAPGARAAAAFYLAGLVFSVLHMPFGPTAMKWLKRVGEDKGIEGDAGADNTAGLVSWLRVNATRGILADFPSWVCYFAAFMCAMS